MPAGVPDVEITLTALQVVDVVCLDDEPTVVLPSPVSLHKPVGVVGFCLPLMIASIILGVSQLQGCPCGHEFATDSQLLERTRLAPFDRPLLYRR